MNKWCDLKKGDPIWVNGEKGEVKQITETYIDGILDSVEISTYIHTSKLLIGRYTGPTALFYTPKKDKDQVASDFYAIYPIQDKYNTSDSLITIGYEVISLDQESAEETKKQIERAHLSFRRDGVESQISELEEQKKTIEGQLFDLRGELREILEVESNL